MIEPYDVLTLDAYVGPHADSPDLTPDRMGNAQKLVLAVNALGDEMQAGGIHFPVNPRTGTRVSGKTFGGFRPQDCPQGAPDSAHKEGMACDLYDPHGDLDAWLDGNPYALVSYDLYREAASATSGWCHLSTRAPPSGNHTFFP